MYQASLSALSSCQSGAGFSSPCYCLLLGSHAIWLFNGVIAALPVLYKHGCLTVGAKIDLMLLYVGFRVSPKPLNPTNLMLCRHVLV